MPGPRAERPAAAEGHAVITLAAILRGLKTLIGIERTAEDLFEITVEAVDPEPRVKGVPLSHRDVEHIQGQIRSASRPAAAPSSKSGEPGRSPNKRR